MIPLDDCDSVLAELDAWLDGSAPQANRARVELHLAGCAECRQIADDARVVVPLARALPLEIQPPRDLWPELEARLVSAPEPAVHPREAPPPGARSGWHPGRWAAAALVLLAIGSGVVTAAGLHNLGPTPTSAPVATTPTPVVPDAVADVEAAATELASAIEVRRRELDPETIAVVEKNLEIIDSAIAEIQAALQADPADGRAKVALVAAYNQKVRLLQAVLHAPARG